MKTCQKGEKLSSLLANQTAYTKHWTAGPAASKTCLLDSCMDKKTEMAAEITQNSGVTFVFHEQNFADPRFVFCTFKRFSCYS